MAQRAALVNLECIFSVQPCSVAFVVPTFPASYDRVIGTFHFLNEVRILAHIRQGLLKHYYHHLQFFKLDLRPWTAQTV